MAGIVGLTEIQHQNGTRAATVDASGRILTPARPAFATTGTNYTQTNNAYSIIIPNAETFDNGSNYNASTGVFTAPIAGLYMFGFWGLLDLCVCVSSCCLWHREVSGAVRRPRC